MSFGFEDKRPLQWGNDHDFNDVIVTLTPAAPTLTGFGIAPAAAPSALADSGAAAPAQGTSASSASTSSRAAVRSASHRQANRAHNAPAAPAASITLRIRAAAATGSGHAVSLRVAPGRADGDILGG